MNVCVPCNKLPTPFPLFKKIGVQRYNLDLIDQIT